LRPGNWIDFDGYFSTTATGISVTVDGDEATTNLSWWAQVLVVAGTVAVGYAIQWLCMLAFTAAAGPAGTAAGGGICAAIGGFFAAFLGGMVEIFANGKQADWRAWLTVLGVSVAAAAGAYWWEQAVRPWFANSSEAFLQAVGDKLTAAGNKIRGWWSAVGDAFSAAGNKIRELASDFKAAMLAAGDKLFGGSGGQQIAVASYIYPTDGAWDRLIAASSSKASVVVANVLNGPGAEKVPAWGSVIDRAHASGKRVLGYVDTGYFGQSDQRRTRLGSLSPADWFLQIQEDVNMWYRLYGGTVDGIFFDDGFNACGPDNQFPDWYQELSDQVKRQHPGALTVLNPGTIVPQCYEGDYSGYVGANPNPALNYKDLGWTPKSPSEIWHIVYCTSPDHIQDVASAAKQRGAGYVEITDDLLPTRTTRCRPTITGPRSRTRWTAARRPSDWPRHTRQVARRRRRHPA
jgi:Spherulation-specific family 4